jgi:coenzyme F420 hydrogenase subunit beta
MVKKQNISQVVSQKLCNTCGACFAVCSYNAIRYQETVGGYYFPVVNPEACTHCGLCFSVCPGINFSDRLFQRMPDDPFTGQALNAFVGKSTNKELFENSQSGGIVSALLVHAMESGRIKGAVTVSMEAGTPPRPVVRIARNRHEIYQSQKSKYCPVPLLCFFRDLEKEDGPMAVVGVSCQIHGLHNILDKMPKLGNKIAFTVGLVCDRVMTYAALDFLVDKSAIDNQTKVVMHFRDKSISGYPGNVHVFSNKGISVEIPSSVRIGIKDFFTPARCRICFDKMNVFSDITVGDPHGLKGVDRRMGESILVVRTKIGHEIVRDAQTFGALNIRPEDYIKIFEGQGINRKRKNWRGYIEAGKLRGHNFSGYFDKIKEYTPACMSVKRYQKKLNYSYKLDDFPSREDLIEFVGKAIKRKQRLNKWLFPFHTANSAIKKVMNRLTNLSRR